jgi:hypothetical protein
LRLVIIILIVFLFVVVRIIILLLPSCEGCHQVVAIPLKYVADVMCSRKECVVCPSGGVSGEEKPTQQGAFTNHDGNVERY